MKNKNLYEKTIKILVNAYLNDTLVKGHCSACAVGNIVAGNMGLSVVRCVGYSSWISKDGKNEIPYWDEVFMTTSEGQRVNLDEYEGDAKAQIDSTGYSVAELALIEETFETNGDDMFTGLMAVVDVLGVIHEVNQEETIESKNLFVKA